MTLTNNWNPTLDEVRAWGYDAEAWLCDQDEDLALYAPRYISVLAALALDAACPKKDVALQYLNLYARDAFERRGYISESEIDAFLEAAQSLTQTAHAGLRKWAEYVIQKAESRRYRSADTRL